MAIRSSVTTTDDRRLYDEIVKDLDDLNDSYVTIGVHEDVGTKKHPGSKDMPAPKKGATIAEIYFFNEFGFVHRNGRRVPARSTLRGAIDEKRSAIEEVRDSALNDVIEQKITVKKGLEKIGFRAREEIKNKFLRGPFASNRPATIARKRENKPLLDSRTLFRSIAYQATVGSLGKLKDILRSE